MVRSMVGAAVDAVASSTPFLVLQVIGTIAFALSGVLAAAKARMDWLGAIVLALVVAIGGGTLRDMLLGQLPVSWLTDSWTVFVAMATAVVMLVVLRALPAASLEQSTSLLVADAVGLSTFVIIGTQVGLDAAIPAFFAVMLGVLTGVGGGVLRDVLTGNRPLVLVGQIYAVAGIVGGTLFAILVGMHVDALLAAWVSVIVAFTIRMVAVRRDWHLPKASVGGADATES